MKKNHKKTSSKIGIALFGVIFVLLMSANVQAKENKASPSRDGDFVKGAQIWAATCVRCHNMRDPNELSDKQWSLVMTHMRSRAGLTGQDRRDVLSFLQASNNENKQK